jgi:transcriptional regulator with XRE-family HTH domain
MVTAEQLRAARAMLHMDQAELARISGVSVETIKRLERQTGKLHAKIETIIAIQKAFEDRRLEFLGDHDGAGAGVRLVRTDKLRLLREALIAKWTHMADQWIRSACAADPKFFEWGEKRVTEALVNLSVSLLPAIVRSVLSDPRENWSENIKVAAESDVGLERYYAGPPVMGVASPDMWPMMTGAPYVSATTRAMNDATCLTRQMLGLIEDPSNLGAAVNRAFVRAFVGTVPAAERGALTDAEGDLSAEGLTRAKNAVLTKAYGDPKIACRLTEGSPDDDIKSLTDGLIMAAPRWAEFRADMIDRSTHPDVAKTSVLIGAIKRIADLRSRGHKLEDYPAQQDASDKVPKAVEDCMRIFYDTAGNRVASAELIAKKLRLYAEKSTKISKRSGSSRR